MPPTIRTGQLATKGTNAVNADRHIVDMLDRIYTYDPASSPMLTVLTARSRVKPANSFEVKHLEDEPIPEWDTDSGSGLNDSATTLNVSNGGYHRAGDILYNPATGEYLRVTAVSTNALTVVRGYGASSGAAIAASQKLLNLGAAEQEGDSSPPAKSTVTVTKSNYTEIKKEPVHLSRTLAETAMYGTENERNRLRVKAGAKHAREWEYVLLFGQKNEDTSTATNPIRTAGGLNAHITTNELDANGTLTETELVDFIGDVNRYKVDGGGGRKALLASRAVLSTMSNWGANKLQTVSGASQRYGFAISEFVTPYGVLDVVNHPLLEEGFEGMAFIVDMAGIMIRPLHRTTLQTNIQDNDEDGYKDQYLTEQSFSFINEKAYGRIKDVTF